MELVDGKTLPLPCVSIAVVAKTVPLPCGPPGPGLTIRTAKRLGLEPDMNLPWYVEPDAKKSVSLMRKASHDFAEEIVQVPFLDHLQPFHCLSLNFHCLGHWIWAE